MRRRDSQRLIARLDHDEPRVRESASRSLATLGDEAVPALIVALEYRAPVKPRGRLRQSYRAWREEVNTEANVAADAARILGEIRNRNAVEPLCRKLHTDADFWVRYWAAWALRAIGDDAALPALADALSSDDFEDVRWVASRALGDAGASGAMPILLEALAHDPAPLVRAAAAEALGKFSSEAAVPGLLQALKDDNQAVREAASTSLARLLP